MREIRIDVYPWPERDSEPHNGYQADIYIDGEWVGGCTAPGDAMDVLRYATDLAEDDD